MNIDEIAVRLEDLSVENDLPELQSLANELTKFGDKPGADQIGRSDAERILHNFVEVMSRTQTGERLIQSAARRGPDLQREQAYREMMRHAEMRTLVAPKFKPI